MYTIIKNCRCHDGFCKAEGRDDGLCVGLHETPPQNYRKTKTFCDETKKCLCWLPNDVSTPCNKAICQAEGKSGVCFGLHNTPPAPYQDYR